jgi:sulfoxide reductase heme-binding subunit YedZ
VVDYIFKNIHAERAAAGPRRRPARRARAKNWETAVQLLLHLAALAPLAVLLWDGVHRQLTANPIQAITFRTGKTALILLVLALACTPLNAGFGVRQAGRWRRPLGVYAFFYAALHFLIFAVLDYGLDLVLLREAIFEKRYALVGFAAFLLLLPLAITSTRGWMKRLGKRWKRLHQAVYPAAILVIVHYVWLVKADRREPLAWGAVVLLLLALRLPAVRRRLSGLSARLARRFQAEAT